MTEQLASIKERADKESWFEPNGESAEEGEHPHYALWDHVGRKWDPLPDGAASLDTAWQEAEAALPKVWPTHKVGGGVVQWNATATAPGPIEGWTCSGDTPALALKALALALRATS